MSIIVDALERVQAGRENEKFDFNDSFFDVHVEKPEDTNKNPSFLKSFRKEFIFVTVLILAFNGYLFLNKSEQDIPITSDDIVQTEPTLVGPLLSISEEPETEDTISEKIISERIDADFLFAFEDEDLSPIENSTPEKRIPSPDSQSSPQAMSKAEQSDRSKPTPNAEQPIMPEVTINTESTHFSNTPPAIKPTAGSKVASNNIAKKMPARSKNWFMMGKQEFYKSGLVNAVKYWNTGLTQLSESTPIISIMINRVEHLSSKFLITLYKNKIDAFTVEGKFKGRPAYFTLALYSESNELDLIARIERTVNVKPYKTTQKFIRTRIEKLNGRQDNIELSNNNNSNHLGTILTQRDTATNGAPEFSSIKLPRKKLSKRKRLKLAENAVINGYYKKAILKLRPLLYKTEVNWEVLFWVGSAKLGLGLYDEADNYFNQALDLNSDIPQLWTQRAIIAQEKNDHLKALEYLQKAKELAPNAPEIILNIAYSNDSLGDINNAIFAYREYLSLTQKKSNYVQQRHYVNIRLSELGN